MVRVSGVPYEVELPIKQEKVMKKPSCSYIFSYHQDDGDYPVEGYPSKKNLSMSIDLDDAEPWDVPLAEFVDFLGAVYGYDIRDKITVDMIVTSGKFKTNLTHPHIAEALADDDEEAV